MVFNFVIVIFLFEIKFSFIPPKYVFNEFIRKYRNEHTLKENKISCVLLAVLFCFTVKSDRTYLVWYLSS